MRIGSKIRRKFKYRNSLGDIRYGRCIGIYYHVGLGKWMFKALSPYGNEFQLSQDEILEWVVS